MVMGRPNIADITLEPTPACISLPLPFYPCSCTTECRLLAEPLFWWLTTFCNLVISCCLSSMAWFYTSTAPLVTIGDAIDSFLTHTPAPDSRTIPRSSCTYSSSAFRNMFRPSLVTQPYKPKAIRWWKAVFLERWSLTMLWLAYFLAQCIIFYKMIKGDKGPTAIFNTKGTTSAAGSGQIIDLLQVDGSDVSPKRWRLVLLANTPQILLSLTYLFLNNILTTMVAEQEWHSFFPPPADEATNTEDKGNETTPTSPDYFRSLVLRCKDILTRTSQKARSSSRTRTLRTSQPRGSQRSTFFLSLPYRYALPFVATSSAMHWLLSQCLFFSEVDFFNIDGELRSATPTTTSMLRYSSWALVWVIILGTLSWGAILALAVLRKYPAGMPVMGCCSAVVAAACFAPLRRGGTGGGRDADGNGSEGGDEEGDGDGDIAAGPLSWGVIRQVMVRDGVEVEEMWLGFTKGQAEMPVIGEVYG